MNAFLDELKLINWQKVFDHSETADPLDTYDIKLSVELDGLMNKHFPLKYVKFNKYKYLKSKWMTNEILLEMKQRDKLYREVHKIVANSCAMCTKSTAC